MGRAVRGVKGFGGGGPVGGGRCGGGAQTRLRAAAEFTGPDSDTNGLAAVISLSGDWASVERMFPALSTSAGLGLRDAALEIV